MGRSRSRSRDRHRRRSRSRDRRDRRSRSRDRYRDRDSNRDGRSRRSSRSRSRDRHRSRSRDRHGSSRRSRSRDRDRSRRSRSKERSRSRERHADRPKRSASRSRSPSKQGRSASQDSAKRRRLEKLQAWKAQQAAAQQANMQQEQPQAEQEQEQQLHGADAGAAPTPAAWMPWDDPVVGAAAGDTAAAAAVQQQALQTPAAMLVDDNDDAGAAQQQQPVQQLLPPGSYSVPADIAIKRAKLSQMEMEQHLRSKAAAEAEDYEDPLDAFMAGEVLPEVKAKQQEEARRVAEEKLKLARELAAGQVPKRPNIWVDTDSDSEGEPDLEIQIPTNKVRLMIGQGGTKIQEIQKKSKARVQVKKSDEELNRAFGSGPLAGLKIPQPGEEKQKDMTTVMIFGDSKAVEIAQRMIEEAVENKEAKARARQKEYERKREQKRRDRQIYHLRHAHDYEALDLPIGASKAEVKKAYKQLARQWHPDKHPEDPETAKAKFQTIQKAYDSLMSTDEEEHVEQIEAKAGAS